MLVLSRRPGETIRVGSDITLTIVEVNGNRVRVGIDAPIEIPVVRGELERAGTACAVQHAAE